MSEALSSLLPTEVSTEAFNSNYLQSHPANPHAILASAEVFRILDNPLEDVENTVFGALNPDVDLKVKVRYLEYMSIIRVSYAHELFAFSRQLECARHPGVPSRAAFASSGGVHARL